MKAHRTREQWEDFDQGADGLLPCPFCGATPIAENGDGNTTHPYSSIQCEHVECIGPGTTAAFFDDAVFQWNTRATPSPTRDGVEDAIHHLITIADSIYRSRGNGPLTSLTYSNLKSAVDKARAAYTLLGAAPGHTDLLVRPESIDAFMEANPLPAPDAMWEALDNLDEIASYAAANSVAATGKDDKCVWDDHARKVRDVIKTLSAPAPSPNAMRTALEAVRPFLRTHQDYESAGYLLRMIDDALRGVAASGVPSPDGAGEQRGHCWCGLHVTLKDQCDRCMKRGVFAPSPAVAAEPVAWRWQHVNDRREPRPWHYEDATWHGNEYMQAEPLYAATPIAPVMPDDQDPPMKWLIERLRGLAIELVADPKTPWIGERDPKQHICWTAADRLVSPPVRGDREAIARIIDPRAWKEWKRYYLLMVHQGKDDHQAHQMADYHWLGDKDASLAKADAILSLPVQSGASEGEALLKYLDIFLHPNPTIDLSGLVCKHGLAIEACPARECSNPMAYETAIKRARDYIALSRQAPHSSSETK